MHMRLVYLWSAWAVVYLHPADKSSMHSYVCTPQHEMGHLRTVFPIARSQEGHQSEDV
jgi:hypothetical protein